MYFRCVTWFHIYICCEMMTTISLTSVTFHSLYNVFLVMRTFKVYTLSNFHIYNIINCSHHALYYTPVTYLFCNWKCVPFDSFMHFTTLTPASPSICSLYLWSWLFGFCCCFRFYIRIFVWLTSNSVLSLRYIYVPTSAKISFFFMAE